MRASRRAPGPSLARHRPCRKSLAAQIGLSFDGLRSARGGPHASFRRRRTTDGAYRWAARLSGTEAERPTVHDANSACRLART